MSDNLPGFDEVDGIDLFQKLPIFRGLTFDETRRLAAIARAERFEAGRVVIEANALGEALFIVKSGAVDVARDDGGREVPLGRLGAGELFGEMSLVDDVLTSATVTVAEDAELFVIPRRDFDSLLAGDAPLAVKVYRAFCRMLSARLRAANAKLHAGDALRMGGY
jgi:CRP-like cAMP-binding protein